MEITSKPKHFKTPQAFKSWLEKHALKKAELWVRFYKKSSKVKGLTYQEALEEALCYGWIDGIRKSFDEDSFVQRFTPRTKKSIWSKRNTLIIEELIKQGKMTTEGLLRVLEAKADGRWDNAYTGTPQKKP